MVCPRKQMEAVVEAALLLLINKRLLLEQRVLFLKRPFQTHPFQGAITPGLAASTLLFIPE